LTFIGLINIQIQGLDELSGLKGKLVICNHPSLLDVVIIMSQLKNIQCVVKHKLWTNPFIGMVVQAAGYIRNDINPQSFLKDCREMLDRGENILIFPEGTRSLPSHQIIMSRGVANLALWAKADIQALTLTCTPAWLYKDSNWYDVPSRRVDFVLRVGDQFLFKDYNNDTPRSIQVRALMRKIKQFYERNI
jgi:1-acyl-sn-glycerol-3-phosphate acyltransferase